MYTDTRCYIEFNKNSRMLIAFDIYSTDQNWSKPIRIVFFFRFILFIGAVVVLVYFFLSLFSNDLVSVYFSVFFIL